MMSLLNKAMPIKNLSLSRKTQRRMPSPKRQTISRQDMLRFIREKSLLSLLNHLFRLEVDLHYTEVTQILDLVYNQQLQLKLVADQGIKE